MYILGVAIAVDKRETPQLPVGTKPPVTDVA
jgi:hypothetical protein